MNKLEIKTEKRDLFYNWLLWLEPVIPLNESERRLLSKYIMLHYVNRSYKEETLYETMFSPKVTESIMKSLNFNKIKYTKAFTSLKDKGLILDNNKLHPNLINYPKSGQFTIQINFKLI